ncbi:PSMA3 [Cordylochernes scorpioides]|uniref:Proteasome subunit alpha type n=1 Tax=Cordylochernes scorpioides TaxID=51811 RepID=A0ABY6LP08_9ARAC|nr:PSMA3 [Cordylochernes scorpioides]
MSSIGTGYDLSASQFSPDGRVFQVEYAQKAVENSGTAIALRGKDGVVFAVEKLVTSKLYEVGANKRIFTVDRHVGAAVAGLIADARQVVETARNEAAEYRSHYGEAIPLKTDLVSQKRTNLVNVQILKDRLAMYMHVYTLYSAIRPFGCSLLMGQYSNGKPELFCVDPSGISWGYTGCAIGKAKQAAKTEMEKLKLKDMSCKELIKEAAKM